MEEKTSLFIYIEKNIDNEDISILDDFELLNSIYPGDIKIIKKNKDELYFLLKIKHGIEIDKPTIDLLHSMELDDFLNYNNDNFIYLPYWLKIFYSKEKKIIKISCYVFWFKYEENIKSELEEKLSDNLEEPILYNIVEETKNVVDKSLGDKKMLNDLLTEIKELKEKQTHITIDNLFLFQTGANKDIDEDFEYDELKLRHISKNKLKKNENKQLTNKKKENMEFKSSINSASTSTTSEIKNANYISILNKIRHKPIIVEFIFSFIKNKPLKIFQIIEKDKYLKNSINSFFISSKKINNLSETLNNNIYIIQIFKSYQDIFFNYNINYNNIFAEEITKTNINSFPSFIHFQAEYILNKIIEDKTKNNYNDIPSINDFIDIHFNLIKTMKNIHLIYLPNISDLTKINNYDGLYIEENIINNKNSLGQEIDFLYCIIDKNEYYKYVKPIKNNITINNIYFAFTVGKEKINIYDAMIHYLNKIKVNTIKEIHLGNNCFQEDQLMNLIKNSDLINQKNFRLSKNTVIKANAYTLKEDDKLKLILGLSLLFDSVNINTDEAKIIDSRFQNTIKVDSCASQKKYIILKIYNFSFLGDKNLKDYFDLNDSISSIILYVSEKAIFFQSDKNNIKKNLDFILKYRHFIILSASPIQFLDEYMASTKTEISNKCNFFK